MKMPARIRAMVVGAALCGAVTMVVAGVLARSSGVGSAYEVVPLVLLLTLTWAYPVLVLRTEETEAFVARQPQSRAMRDRARRLAGGATDG